MKKRRCIVYLSYLKTPKFDGPINRGREKKVRKINRPLRVVAIHTTNWSLVSLVCIDNTSTWSMTTSFWDL